MLWQHGGPSFPGLLELTRRCTLPVQEARSSRHYVTHTLHALKPQDNRNMWLLCVCLCVQELLGEMMGSGRLPTLHAYEAVMEAYAQHRDLDAAEAVLDRMQAAGLQPVLRTYNRLLHGVGMNGSLAAAIRVYNRLKLQGLQPDVQTMRCLFKCVRLYAINVRVATARSIYNAKAANR